MEKKGLSAVVTTLIIILLVLVSVGVIWVVVSNVIESGAEQIESSNKCFSIGLSAQSVAPVSGEAGNYSVTIKRSAGGEDIGGIKLNIFNSTDSSGLLEFGVALGEIETITRTIDSGILNADRLEYTAYFVDASGNEQICSQTGSKDF